MPRLTPIDYKRFEKFLKYIGCEFIRQRGSHRVYIRPGLKRPIIIPAVKDISIFVILNNLRILGISREEYLSIISKL